MGWIHQLGIGWNTIDIWFYWNQFVNWCFLVYSVLVCRLIYTLLINSFIESIEQHKLMFYRCWSSKKPMAFSVLIYKKSAEGMMSSQDTFAPEYFLLIIHIDHPPPKKDILWMNLNVVVSSRWGTSTPSLTMEIQVYLPKATQEIIAL